VLLALDRREHRTVFGSMSGQPGHVVRECQHLSGEMLVCDANLARGPELADPVHGRPHHEVVQHRLAERQLERLLRDLFGRFRIARQERYAEAVRDGLCQQALAELVAAALHAYHGTPSREGER
jgi:hypothetical protein